MSIKRRVRRWLSSTSVESLEGRELLTAGGIYGLDGEYINKFDYKKLLAKRESPPAPPNQRRVELMLPQYGPNAKAVITLYGPGTIMGDLGLTPGTPAYDAVNTHVNSTTGQIHILFDGTTSESQIIGMVTGTKAFPKINEIRDVDVSSYDTTGVGTNQMGYVNLARFDLARGGRVNFAAGVQRIFLNDIEHGTQLDLAALKSPPLTSPQNPGGLNSTTTTSNAGASAVANQSGVTTTTTTVNGITVVTTLPTTDQLVISNGELTGIGGITLPGSVPSTSRNTRLEIQGVELIVRNVNGVDNPLGQPEPRLGKEYIAGADDTNDKLVFYQIQRNASTFAIESAVETAAKPSISVTAPASFGAVGNLNLIGAATGQYSNGTFQMTPTDTVKGSIQVVAVGYSFDYGGQTRYLVNAYSVIDGSLQGWFEVKDSSGNPLAFDGIGGSSGDIYLTNATGGSSGTGFTQGVDLSGSLDTPDHRAVPVGTGLNYPSTFKSKGGTTGVTGVSYIYNVGVSYFNAWNPENPDPQLGIMKIGVDAKDNLSVSTTAKVGGSIPWSDSKIYVMGSVDQNLALIDPTKTSTDTGGTYYSASMFDPDTLGGSGSFKLYVSAGTKLTGLSESFYPQLLGSSVIDVKGNLKTFSAVNTNNMVLNVNGIAGYTRINRARNTTIIGHPVLHLAVSWRAGDNVNILSSARPSNDTPGGYPRPGTRGGVQIVKNLPVIGPFVNPAQSSATG